MCWPLGDCGLYSVSVDRITQLHLWDVLATRWLWPVHCVCVLIGSCGYSRMPSLLSVCYCIISSTVHCRLQPTRSWWLEDSPTKWFTHTPHFTLLTACSAILLSPIVLAVHVCTFALSLNHIKRCSLLFWFFGVCWFIYGIFLLLGKWIHCKWWLLLLFT